MNHGYCTTNQSMFGEKKPWFPDPHLSSHMTQLKSKQIQAALSLVQAESLQPVWQMGAPSRYTSISRAFGRYIDIDMEIGMDRQMDDRWELHGNNYMYRNQDAHAWKCVYSILIHIYIHTYIHTYLLTYLLTYIHTCVCVHQGQSVKNWQFAKLLKWLKDYVLLFWVYEEVSLGPRSFGTCVMPQTCHALGDRRPLAGWSNGHLGGQNVGPRPPISVCKHLSSGGTQVWCRPIWT